MDWTFLFWVFPLLCMVFMMIMMFRHGGSCMPFAGGHRGRSGNGGESPQQILDRRYASGQISKEQYEAMRRDLNQPRIEAQNG
jgi:putative membrane protein